MFDGFIHVVGATAATLTTLCWLPQALKTIRDKDTRALSLSTNIAFTLGVACWLVYGLMLENWPIIVANIVTLALMSVILGLKLKYG